MEIVDLPVNLQQLALWRRQCRKVPGENERSPTQRFTVPVSAYTELYPPSSTDLDRLQPGNAVNHGHRLRTAAMVLAHHGTFSEEHIDVVDGQLSGGLGQLVDGWTR